MNGYGQADNTILRSMHQSNPDSIEAQLPMTALDFTMKVCKLVLERRIATEGNEGGQMERHIDFKVLAFLHIIFVFVHSMSEIDEGMPIIDPVFPWKQASTFFNELSEYCSKQKVRRKNDKKGAVSNRPQGDKDVGQILPEEVSMRGLLFARTYLAEKQFKNVGGKRIESRQGTDYYTQLRCERLLKLGKALAEESCWLIWDDDKGEFQFRS